MPLAKPGAGQAAQGSGFPLGSVGARAAAAGGRTDGTKSLGSKADKTGLPQASPSGSPLATSSESPRGAIRNRTPMSASTDGSRAATGEGGARAASSKWQASKTGMLCLAASSPAESPRSMLSRGSDSHSERSNTSPRVSSSGNTPKSLKGKLRRDNKVGALLRQVSSKASRKGKDRKDKESPRESDGVSSVPESPIGSESSHRVERPNSFLLSFAPSSSRGRSRASARHNGSAGGTPKSTSSGGQWAEEADDAPPNETPEEREARKRHEAINRDLKDIMAKHRLGLAHPPPPPRTIPAPDSTMSSLSAMLKGSFAEGTHQAERMTPLQQQELLKRQTMAEISQVEAALEQVRHSAQHSPPVPPARRPKSQNPESPRSRGRRYEGGGVEGAVEGDDVRGPLGRQAMYRYDMTRVTNAPITRGLLPDLPSSVVHRAAYQVNKIYGDHVPGRDKDRMVREVCVDAKAVLLDKAPVIHHLREAADAAPQNWKPRMATCLPDDVAFSGELDLASPALGGSKGMGAARSKGLTATGQGAPVQGGLPASPRVVDNRPPVSTGGGMAQRPRGIIDSTSRVIYLLGPTRTARA